jgi:4-amino-4-deoxy-L-arabinose transferase-like glycosyltransferase
MSNLSKLKPHFAIESAYLIALSLVAYFAFFWRLDVMQLELYDESRQAVNAIEMAIRGNIWCVTYDGQPELWNTKPPLLIWLINCSTFLFGNNLLALRLPTALAGLASVFIVYGFVKQQTQSVVTGFTAAIILASSWGFIGIHAARTADFDALLALWVLLYAIYIYKFLETESANKKHLFWAAIFMLLAIFTKGIAALLPLPGMFLYAAFAGKLKRLLTNKWVYISAALVLGLTAAYYLYRDGLQPGYILAIWNNELLGRYSAVAEFHSEPWYYYFDNFYQNRYPYYWWLVVIAGIGGWFTLKSRQLSLYAFAIAVALMHLVVISVSKSKLLHYDVPEYPFYAIAIALFFGSLLQAKPWVKYSSSIVLVSAFAIGFNITAHSINNLRVGSRVHSYGAYFNKMEQQKPAIRSFKAYSLGHGGYNSVLDYYRLVYIEKGYKIKKGSINPQAYNDTAFYTLGDTVVSCDEGIVNYLKQTYVIDSLFADENCITVVLKSLKKPF